MHASRKSHGTLGLRGPAAHFASDATTVNPMSRRGIHPALMKCNQRDDETAETKELTGYESAQRKRFLRAEQEELDGGDSKVA